MELSKIIHNTEQRFKTAESKSTREYLWNSAKLLGKSALRGGIIGGLVGYLVGGDWDSTSTGIFIGSSIDMFQNIPRLSGLISMYRNKEKVQEYKEHKNKYKELGWIN